MGRIAALAVAFAVSVLMLAGCGSLIGRSAERAEAGQAAGPSALVASDADCKADRAWIDAPSQPDGSKFNATSNCSFHQWSYQTFLWLVSPHAQDGGLVFEGFANPKDLFLPDGPPVAYPGRGAGDPLTLLARFGKSSTTADIDEIFQAGPGNKALIDQAGNIVYYENHLNDYYWKFVDDRRLYELANLQAADPALNFPTDALELKSSWRIAQIAGQPPIIADAEKRYFVVSAQVPSVAANAKGILEEDRSKMIDARMALIGLHVAGIVEGHPEFIWATFEHVENAPDCADIPPPKCLKDKPCPPAKKWNLYNGTASRATANQFVVGDPMAVVNVCLAHPDGAGSADNQSAIQTLNANVQVLLGDDLWSNYRLGGAVWTSGEVPVNNGAFTPAQIDAAAQRHRRDPNKRAEPTQLGSLELANSSMETFTQDDNCFACHNGGTHEIVVNKDATEINAKNLNLSHFVVNYQAVQQILNENK